MLLPTINCEECGRAIDPAKLVGRRVYDVRISEWQCVTIGLTPGTARMTHTCVHVHGDDASRWDGAPITVDGLSVVSHLMGAGHSPSPRLAGGLRPFGVRPCGHCGRRFKPSIWGPDRHPRWGLELCLLSDDRGEWPWWPSILTANCPWCGEGHSVVGWNDDVGLVRMFLDTILSAFPPTIVAP